MSFFVVVKYLHILARHHRGRVFKHFVRNLGSAARPGKGSDTPQLYACGGLSSSTTGSRIPPYALPACHGYYDGSSHESAALRHSGSPPALRALRDRHPCSA